jgi:S1-C subfamily serine protease
VRAPGGDRVIAELRILTGARAGHVASFEPGTVILGRGPTAQLRFSETEDLEVSQVHARLDYDDGGWHISDLSSRNGTFVNGVRIGDAVRLRVGDRVGCGPSGPVLEFRMAAAHRSRWRPGAYVAAAVAMLVPVVTLAALLASTRVERRAWATERATLLADLDTLLARSEALVAAWAAESSAAAGAVVAAREEVRHARAAAATAASADPVQLRRQLQSAEAALARQQLAASLDTDRIARLNGHAVVRLYVEGEDGAVRTGSGFAVRPDGTIATARHLLGGSSGVRRLGVQFAYSDQVWPARVLAVDEQHDLAVVKVDNILGAVPNTLGFAPRAEARDGGVPVAIIGFPRGGEPARGAGPTVARPLVSVGVLLGFDESRVEIQGYGASGGSGSPIFNDAGLVTAMLFGGRRDGDVQVLLAVPAAAVVRLLDSVP